MTRETGSVIAAVSGDSVEIDQSAVRSVDAERVELRQAAARRWSSSRGASSRASRR